MKALHDQYAFGLFASYVVSGVIAFNFFQRGYMWLTPYDDEADITAGKVAPAIMLCGAKLGFVIPLLAASFVGATFLDYLAWAAISALVQAVWFYISFWVWKSEKTDPYNVPIALSKAVSAVCVGLIQAFSMIP